MPPRSVVALSGEGLRGKGRHGVMCGQNCVIHTWAPSVYYKRRSPYINPLDFTVIIRQLATVYSTRRFDSWPTRGSDLWRAFWHCPGPACCAYMSCVAELDNSSVLYWLCLRFSSALTRPTRLEALQYGQRVNVKGQLISASPVIPVCHDVRCICTPYTPPRETGVVSGRRNT